MNKWIDGGGQGEFEIARPPLSFFFLTFLFAPPPPAQLTLMHALHSTRAFGALSVRPATRGRLQVVASTTVPAEVRLERNRWPATVRRLCKHLLSALPSPLAHTHPHKHTTAQYKTVAPVGSRVVVEVDKAESTSMGGILLPTAAQVSVRGRNGRPNSRHAPPRRGRPLVCVACKARGKPSVPGSHPWKRGWSHVPTGGFFCTHEKERAEDPAPAALLRFRPAFSPPPPSSPSPFLSHRSSPPAARSSPPARAPPWPPERPSPTPSTRARRSRWRTARSWSS